LRASESKVHQQTYDSSAVLDLKFLRSCPRPPRDVDTISKLDEYKAIDSVERILLIESNAPEVVVWTRSADRSWRQSVIKGLQRQTEIPEIGVTLPLLEIYDGVAFPARPQLVLDEAPPEPGTQSGS
jgi:hypothetical protein